MDLAPNTSFVVMNGTTSLAATIATHQAQEMGSGVFIKTEQQLRQERHRQKKWTIAIATVCMAAFFIGLTAMLVEGSGVAYLAFLFPLFTGPYAIHQRRKLNKLPTLVYVMNQLREQVNRMMLQNKKLHAENNRLATEVTRLNDAETRLQAVASKSGSNVATVCELVKENAESQRQMKLLQNAMELQTLLTAVLQSDANADHVLSPQELEMLILRLSSFSVADEAKLREAFQRASATSASTTTLYAAAASQSFAEDGSGDITFGYGEWLFEEAD